MDHADQQVKVLGTKVMERRRKVSQDKRARQGPQAKNQVEEEEEEVDRQVADRVEQ